MPESTPKGHHAKQRQEMHKILWVTQYQQTQVCIFQPVMGEPIHLGYSQIPIIQVTVMQKVVASKQPSDWDEDLIDLTQADNTASNQNKNQLPSDWSDEENQFTSGKAEAQLQATPRQPPPGWASWRKKESLPVSETEKDKSNAQETNTEVPVESNKTNNGVQKLTIEEVRSLVEEEFLAID